MRDYSVMREVLAVAAKAKGELHYGDFRNLTHGQDDMLQAELARLDADGLLDGDVHFGHGFGEQSRCNVSGLTPEGFEFYRLIENEEVWVERRSLFRPSFN